MADGAAWASGGQGRKRRIGEVVPSSTHGPPSIDGAASLHPPRPGPWGHQVEYYAMLPCTYEEEPTQSMPLLAANETPFRPSTLIGPAVPPHHFQTVSSMYMTTGGGSTYLPGQSVPSSTPQGHDAEPYAGVTNAWSLSRGSTLGIHGQPAAADVRPLAVMSHDGLPTTMGYPDSVPPDSQPVNQNPVHTMPQSQPLAACLLPIAPKPSSMTHVPLKTTPAGTIGCIGRGTRRKFDAVGLEKVNQVRKNGACLRCKCYKLSCDNAKPCSPCKKVADSIKIPRGPCINPRLDTVQAFRGGDGDNRTTVPTLPVLKWARRSEPGAPTSVTPSPIDTVEESSTSMMVEVTWPFAAGVTAETPVIQIPVQRFEPEGQNLSEEWTPPEGGQTRTVALPPLACRDTNAAGKSISAFLQACQGPLERQILGMLDDPITTMTWHEVLRVRDDTKDPILSKAVRLHAAVLMNTRYPKSVRANIFDLAEEPEPPFWFERNLLPPQLTFQIQMLIAMEQINLQRDVISGLKRLMFHKRRQEHWHMVFLLTFVLLSAIELMHYNQTSFLLFKEQNSETSRANVSYVTRYMLGQWEDSAENLISHFRFVTRGNVIFSQEGSNLQKSIGKACLDRGALDYVTRIREEISGRWHDLLQARKSRKVGSSRTDMWAVCELFLPDSLDSPHESEN